MSSRQHPGGKRLLSRNPRKHSSRPRGRNPPSRRLRAGKTSSYAPSSKKAFKRMSNPLSENKQLLGSEISATVGLSTTDGTPILTDLAIPPIDAAGVPTGAGGHSMDTQHFNYNPDSALYQTQGLDESQMVGRSTYHTLTAAKMLIKWPQPCMDTGIELDDKSGNIMGVIPECPMSYKLYWGYVPLKYLFTGKTSPKASECSAYQLETLMNQRVKDYFDERNDRIQFIPKKTATIEIIGSKRVFPPLNEQAGRLPVSLAGVENASYAGSLPDTLVKMKWSTNRKIHYEPTTLFANISGSNTPEKPANNATVFYRNYSGKLPFAVLVNWNWDKLPVDNPAADPDDRFERKRRCPQCLVQDITYYRDS